jgi:tetratricopeptide (TPR) repeat protein
LSANVKTVNFIDNLLIDLQALPNFKNREFELKLTGIAGRLKAHEVQLLREWFDEQIKKDNYNETLLFAVFILLTICYRRSKDRSRLQSVIEQVGLIFSENPFYWHVLSMLKKELDKFEESLLLAKKAMEELPKHAGVIHNYVESIVIAKEHGYSLSDVELLEAYEKLVQLISYSDYPKYFCTQGRFLAVMGKYAEAKVSISIAVDKEDSTREDYAIRINEYQSHLMRIQTMEFKSIIEQELSKTKEDIREKKQELDSSLRIQREELDKQVQGIKSENLQTLGFFVAIISFTIGSINLLKERTFLESSFLILILTSSLTLAYVGFSLVFQFNMKKGKQTAIISVLAVLIIIGSILGNHYLK